MPSFSDYHDFEVDVEEFLNECTPSEIDDVIQWLGDNEYIKDSDMLDNGPHSALEQLFIEDLDKIRNAYLQISKEDFELINQIAKKY